MLRIWLQESEKVKQKALVKLLDHRAISFDGDGNNFDGKRG